MKPQSRSLTLGIRLATGAVALAAVLGPAAAQITQAVQAGATAAPPATPTLPIPDGVPGCC